MMKDKDTPSESKKIRKKLDVALSSSEHNYRDLFEQMPQGAFYQLADGTLIDVNNAALKMLGLTRDQFLGRTSHDPGWKVVNEKLEDLPPDQHASMIALSTGKPVVDLLLGVYRPDTDSYVWLITNAIPYFHEGEEKPYQVCVTMHDITERNRAQEALRKSEVNFNHLFNRMAEGVAFHRLIYDPAGVAIDYIILAVNPAFENHTDIKNETALGRLASELYDVHPAPFLEIYERVVRTGSPESFQSHIAEMGRDFEVSVYSPEKDHFITIFSDITNRINAERELQNSELKYRRIFENTQDVIFQIGLDGMIKEISPSIERLSGFLRSDLIGRNAMELYLETGVDESMTPIIAAQGSISDHQVQLRTKDGRLRWASMNAHIIFDVMGQPIGIEGSIHDIHERILAQEALKESGLLFSNIFQLSPIAITLTSVETGKYHDVNEIFLRDTGYSRDEVIGHTSAELKLYYDIDDREMHTGAVLREGAVYGLEIKARMKSGELRYCLVSTVKIIIAEQPYFLSTILLSLIHISEPTRPY
jgi:PAS domain S-box-containing protein